MDPFSASPLPLSLSFLASLSHCLLRMTMVLGGFQAHLSLPKANPCTCQHSARGEGARTRPAPEGCYFKAFVLPSSCRWPWFLLCKGPAPHPSYRRTLTHHVGTPTVPHIWHSFVLLPSSSQASPGQREPEGTDCVDDGDFFCPFFLLAGAPRSTARAAE